MTCPDGMYLDRYLICGNRHNLQTLAEKLAEQSVGILLCLTKNDELVELTLPENANIYASEYHLYLPDKEALKKLLEQAQAELEAYHENQI